MYRKWTHLTHPKCLLVNNLIFWGYFAGIVQNVLKKERRSNSSQVQSYDRHSNVYVTCARSTGPCTFPSHKHKLLLCITICVVKYGCSGRTLINCCKTREPLYLYLRQKSRIINILYKRLLNPDWTELCIFC